MAPKQRNLLEAFRDAGDSGAGEDTSSAGPFAGPPQGASKDSGLVPPPLRRTSEKGPLPPWAAVVLVGAVCFVLGVAVGRSTGGAEDETRAAERGNDSTPGTTDPGGDPAGIRPGTGRGGAADTPRGGAGEAGNPPSDLVPPDPVAALRDPANVYTVIAVTYGGSQESTARATQKLLADLGLPVFPPVKVGAYLEILVGAGPTTSSLAGLLQRVQDATDWNGDKAFSSAYVVKIDDHVNR